MAKYAPKDSEGRKPYVRRTEPWGGRAHEYVMYADFPSEVRYAFRPMNYETVRVRRATTADVECTSVHLGWEANRAREDEG